MNKSLYILLSIITFLSAGSCSVIKQNPPRSSNLRTEVKAENPYGTEIPKDGQMQAIAGTWTILQVDSLDLTEEEDLPYLNFVPSTYSFYGSNGCNIINGAFQVMNGILTPSQVLTTLRACPESYSQVITNLMSTNNPLKLQIFRSGRDYTATISSAAGHHIIMRRNDSTSLGGLWQVEKIGHEAVDSDELNIFINTDEGKVHGNTGCNFFNGAVNLTPTPDPTEHNSISFTNMGVTRMTCPTLERETKMLVALEQTASYSISGTTLTLYNAADAPVMTLKKSEVNL